MYITLTGHFKGKTPIDIGGFVISSRGPVLVSDDLGKRILPKNFPFVVPCDKDGKYLVSVPAMKVAPPPPEKVIEPIADLQADSVEEVSDEEEKQPVFEPVVTGKRKGK
jgi:hypothetical protein